MSEERPTPDDEAAFVRASETLDAIEKLKRFGPFNNYFCRRLKEESEKLKVQILDPETPDDKVHELKVEHQAIERILRMSQDDEIGVRSTIDQTPRPAKSEEEQSVD